MEQIEFSQLKQSLERIERNTLLAARDVLTFSDALLITGLSKSSLYKLTHAKKIPHYKPTGGLIYFDRVELESWLKQNRICTTEEIEEIADTYLATGKMGGC